MVHDTDTGEVVHANPAAGDLLGAEPQEIVGLHVGEFSPSEFTTADANALIEEAVAEGNRTVEWAISDPSGQQQWVEVRLNRAAIGGQTRVVAYIHRVTDRKTRERQQSEKNEQLTTLIGIPPAQRRRVFERGQKESGSSGTGFGLYFVDSMVESDGGNIWFEDSDSGGAAFVVEPPRTT